jgi:hypothetical protein
MGHSHTLDVGLDVRQASIAVAYAPEHWTPSPVVQPIGFADFCRSLTPAALASLISLHRVS